MNTIAQTQLYDPSRHETLSEKSWNAESVKEYIHYIIEKTINAYSEKKLWPVHPDIKETYKTKQPLTGLWMGAAGIIWSLQHLNKYTQKELDLDYTYFFEHLDELQKNSFAEFDPNFEIKADAPGFMMGLIAPLLLQWTLTKNSKTLDRLEKLIQQNIHNPINELMWAAPGTMLAAFFLYETTQESRWKTLYQSSAEYLINQYQHEEKTDSQVWIQDMYGSKAIHLGLVHGFSGNTFCLLKGMHLLTDSQQGLILNHTAQTLKNSALEENNLINWPTCLGIPRKGREKNLLHICHGAPGVLIGVSNNFNLFDDEVKSRLLKAGELIWHAGPLKKPWGLCHGTAGNAYAFLKLFSATQDDTWLHRAKQFAMHAIEQSKQAEQEHQQLRFDLWCGDLGLAMFLNSCLEETPAFPTLDYF